MAQGENLVPRYTSGASRAFSLPLSAALSRGLGRKPSASLYTFGNVSLPLSPISLSVYFFFPFPVPLAADKAYTLA